MDRQQLYNTARDKLVEQGQLALKYVRGTATDVCQYRGGGPAGDCRCAIGHLIPDKLYDPAMEGKLAEAVVTLDHHNIRRLGKKLIVALRGHLGISPDNDPSLHSAADINFLGRLQQVHDDLAREHAKAVRHTEDAIQLGVEVAAPAPPGAKQILAAFHAFAAKERLAP